MRGARLAAVLAAAFWLPGTAAALFDDDEARRRIDALRQQVEANARALEDRLARIEDRRPLVELAGQIEAVRAELAKMRGQLEVLANQIDTADKRQKDLYVDIDTRLRKLEQPKDPVATDKPPADNAVPAAETKGYEAYASAAGALQRMGMSGFLEGFLDATAHGTPEQVIAKYRERWELLGPFEAAPAFRFGGIPYEEAEASMRLFAAEVLPELKSWV